MMLRISSEASVLSRRAFSTLRILPRSGRIAWNARSRPCLAEPPAESPSTRKSSRFSGSRSWQSASLPGRPRAVERALAAGQVARLARRLAGPGGVEDLAGRCAWRLSGSPRGSSASRSLTRLSTMPLTSELPSLPLVWPSNCGLGTLTLMTADRPSRVSSPSKRARRFLDAGPPDGVGVEGAGERASEAGEVGAAVVGVDVVGEAVDVLGVAVVPLQRDLDDRPRRARPRSRSAAAGASPCSGSGARRRRRCRPRTGSGASCRRARPSRVIRMPRFRNASSRRRWERVSKLKVVVSKICGVGLEGDPWCRAGR